MGENTLPDAMTPTPKYLTGDKKGIQEFIEQFDVGFLRVIPPGHFWLYPKPYFSS